ncbi:MAG: energy-coupling factor transporter transmembrane protein EcfT [Oscillospiraceae bacterium]|nr:energy-coupling factor transporter transmembrane protein EcfT [Oscillospiraceae bacterium]
MVFNYIERDSIIHGMTGSSKLLGLLLWTFAAMVTFNTPFLIFLSLLAVTLFPLSKLRIRDVKVVFAAILIFMIFNNFLIYLFAPEQGCEIYGTRNLLFTFGGRYTVTKEQLLYQLNVILKYTATIPLIIVFAASTNPSELASSLNRIGLSYAASYSVALALRYIPDTVNEFLDISKSQQARGIEMSKKENIFKRIKAAALIVLPLLLTSVERIERITNAMELRKFGREKKRTWITSREFKAADYIAVGLGVLFIGYALYFNISNGSRYYNPFI